MNKTTSKVVNRRIESFEKRFGKAHLYLAYHAAFPLALTPDLLYRLWANFQRDINGEVLNIPWIAVADLLLSSLCNEVGYELYEIDLAIRNMLLIQLKQDEKFGQKRINELSDFLLNYVEQQLESDDSDIRDFAQTQKWMALAYTRPNQAAHELALAFSKLDENDTAELVRMAALTETFAEPLAEFQPLLIYARGMRKFASGDIKSTQVLFKQLLKNKHKIQVERVNLRIPHQIRYQLKKNDKYLERDYLLIFILSIFNVVSGYTTITGVKILLDNFILAAFLGGYIHLVLFLTISEFILKNAPLRKWIIVILFTFVSVYTSFFTYYTNLISETNILLVDNKITFLRPYLSLISQDINEQRPAFISLLIATLVDGMSILLGTAITIEPNRRSPILRFARFVANSITDIKSSFTEIEQAVKQPNPGVQITAEGDDKLSEVSEILTLELRGRGSDFLKEFRRAIDKTSPHYIKHTVFEQHPEQSYRDSFDILIDQLSNPKLGWIEVDNNQWRVKKQDYHKTVEWLRQEILRLTQEEKSLDKSNYNNLFRFKNIPPVRVQVKIPSTQNGNRN